MVIDKYRISDLKHHKNFPIYLMVMQDKFLHSFFSVLSKNYNTIKDEYLENFKFQIASLRKEYLELKDKVKADEEKLKGKNIKLYTMPDEHSIIGGKTFWNITFINKGGNAVHLSKEDIEFMKNYIEENKNSNIEKEIVSKAEIEYNKLKGEKNNLVKQGNKELRIIKLLRRGDISVTDLFSGLQPVYEKHNRKFIEIKNRIEEIESLDQKAKFLKNLKFSGLEAILNFYKTYIKYETIYKKFYSLERKRDNNEIESEIYGIALSQTLNDLMINDDKKNLISYKLYAEKNKGINSSYLPVFLDSFVFSYSMKNAIDWYYEYFSLKLSLEQLMEYSEKERKENNKKLLKELRKSRKNDLLDF